MKKIITLKVFLLVTLVAGAVVCQAQESGNEVATDAENLQRVKRWIAGQTLIFNAGNSKDLNKYYRKIYKDILNVCEKVNDSIYQIGFSKILTLSNVKFDAPGNRPCEIVLNMQYFFKGGNYQFEDLRLVNEFVMNSTIDSVWARDRIVMKVSHVYNYPVDKIEVISTAYPYTGRVYWIEAIKNIQANNPKCVKNGWSYPNDRSSWERPVQGGVWKDVAYFDLFKSGVPIHINFTSHVTLDYETGPALKDSVFYQLIRMFRAIVPEKCILQDLDKRAITVQFVKGRVTRAYWESIKIFIQDIVKNGNVYTLVLEADGDYYAASSEKPPEQRVFKRDLKDLCDDYPDQFKNFSSTIKKELKAYLSRL